MGRGISTVKTCLSYQALSGGLPRAFGMIGTMIQFDRPSGRIPTRTAGLSAAALLIGVVLAPMTANAQLRVDTRLYASSGSCAQCDLSGKRMNGMTLKNANFSGSLFNNSNLSGGKLDGSDLSHAHFKKARLYGVTGQGVVMNGAVLEDATLTDATLSHSNMRQANLKRADLSRGHFNNNDFGAANLMAASAQSSNFSHSNFKLARLDNADFSGATLDESHFVGTRFGFANLTDATLDGADLSDADLTHVVGLTQAQLESACGNMNTRLPSGLRLSYCEGAAMSGDQRVAQNLPQNIQAATDRLDRAILDIETLLAGEPNAQARSRLQRIHRDLNQTRDTLTR